MTTESKSLHMRRATPLDAVNLLKLLVNDEKRAGTGRPFNEAARLTRIIEVIAAGYVAVVVHAGRIVGSIGCAPGLSGDEHFLIGEWFAVIPSYRDSKVGPRLIQSLARFADLHRVSVVVELPADEADLRQPVLAELGFELKTRTYEREPQAIHVEQREDERSAEPEPAGDEPPAEREDVGPR